MPPPSPKDPELSQRNREITATNDWTELTSPYYYSDTSPLAYNRHYTVATEEGFLITMEVNMNLLLYTPRRNFIIHIYNM